MLIERWRKRWTNLVSNKPTVLIAVLAAALLLSIIVIVYQNLARKRANSTSATRAPSGTQNDFRNVLSSFLSSLSKGDAATKQSHQDLSNYLRTLDTKTFPSAQELKSFVSAHDIPYDYSFFIKDCLPGYGESLRSGGSTLKDSNIILSLAAGANYKASLFVNSTNLPAEKLSQTVDVEGSGNRLVISGTYTSPSNMPVGLTIDRGTVINPAIQKFEGILVIHPDGRMFFTHIGELQSALRALNIRSSFSDYKEFIDNAGKEKLSVIQTQLVLNSGSILVDNDPAQKRYRKRLLFETSDGGIHIYDSFDRQLTLFEAAKHVKENYKATKAANLETGTYDFCTINRNNQLQNRSELKNGNVLSNLLIIDF